MKTSRPFRVLAEGAIHTYFFAADGRLYVADVRGRIVREFAGAIDTIHQESRRGLASSHSFTSLGATAPQAETCWRVDMDRGTMTEVLQFDAALALLRREMNLTGVPPETLSFKHTKWAPDGRDWFVVFTNEDRRNGHPEIPRIKVLLAARDDGSDLRLIGSFGHHPKPRCLSRGSTGRHCIRRTGCATRIRSGPPTVDDFISTPSRGNRRGCA